MLLTTQYKMIFFFLLIGNDLDRSLSNFEFLKSFVEVFKLASDDDSISEKEGIFLQFRLWEQGRIDLEDMVDRLEAIVKHALWEVVTEYFMMPNDFTGSTSMNGQCHECLNKEVQCVSPIGAFFATGNGKFM